MEAKSVNNSKSSKNSGTIKQSFNLKSEIIPEDKKLSITTNCRTSIIEMGIIEVCTFTNTNIEKIYKDIIINNEIEESEYLLKIIPKKNQIIEVDNNGLMNIEYKINSNKLEIEFDYDGGVNTITIEQLKENVKRTISHSAD